MLKFDNYVSLIGGNPLPAVISISTCYNQNGKLFLITSERSFSVAEQIKNWCIQQGIPNEKLIILQVDPFAQQEIVTKITNETDQLSNFGIDLTGGTKLMSIAGYRSLQKLGEERESGFFTYLRSTPWQLLTFNEEKLIDTNQILISFDLEEIMFIHGYKEINISRPSELGKQKPVSTVIRKIHDTFSGGKTWHDWMKDEILKKCRDSNRNWKEENKLGSIEINFRNEIQSVSKQLGNNKISITTFSVAQLTDKLGFDSNQDTCSWFAGKWLETYVFHQLDRKDVSSNLDDYAVNVETRDPRFEIDVVALRGSQLFVISCTTITDTIPGGRSKIKDKIFEVIIRSRQLGGLKTKNAIICMSDDPEDLSNEVNNLMIDREIRIWGREHLNKLHVHISNWIKDDGVNNHSER